VTTEITNQDGIAAISLAKLTSETATMLATFVRLHVRESVALHLGGIVSLYQGMIISILLTVQL